jgi:hypothetical protein
MYSISVTLTPFHCPEQDIKIGDYDIPKDSIIMIDCKAPSKDRQFWTDPEDFKPERFLDTNSSQRLPDGCFIPYGTGRDSIHLREGMVYFYSHFLKHKFVSQSSFFLGGGA